MGAASSFEGHWALAGQPEVGLLVSSAFKSGVARSQATNLTLPGHMAAVIHGTQVDGLALHKLQSYCSACALKIGQRWITNNDQNLARLPCQILRVWATTYLGQAAGYRAHCPCQLWWNPASLIQPGNHQAASILTCCRQFVWECSEGLNVVFWLLQV